MYVVGMYLSGMYGTVMYFNLFRAQKQILSDWFFDDFFFIYM